MVRRRWAIPGKLELRSYPFLPFADRDGIQQEQCVSGNLFSPLESRSSVCTPLRHFVGTKYSIAKPRSLAVAAPLPSMRPSCDLIPTGLSCLTQTAENTPLSTNHKIQVAGKGTSSRRRITHDARLWLCLEASLKQALGQLAKDAFFVRWNEL